MRLIKAWKSLRVQIKTAIILAILVVVSLVLSEKSWGFNYLWFLPDPAILLILALSGGLVFISIKKSGKEIAKKQAEQKASPIPVWAISVVLPISALIVTLLFPLVTEGYGDTRSIITKYTEFFGYSKSYVDSLIPLIDLDIFSLHNGERFTFNFVRLVKGFTHFDLEDSFKVYGAMWAVSSALIYSLYVRSLNRVNLLMPTLFFISLNSILVVSGHIEVYGPSLFFLLLFMYVGRLHFQKNSFRTALFLTLALFFAVKSHFIHFILLAPYAYLVLIRLKSDLFNYLTFRNVLVIFLSGFLGFVLAYFFVFENQNSHYALGGNDLTSNVFLPLFAPASPYNEYSLFHINHITDIINLVLFWSPVLILALFAVFSQKAGHLFMRDNYFLIVVFGLFGYLAISFVLNPLLSLPRDWDLLSIGTPFLLIWVTELWYAQDGIFRRKIGPQLLAAFLLFTVPRTIVESQEHLSGMKQLSTGLHVFKTYYAGSSVLLSKGIRQLRAKEEDFISDLMNDLLDGSRAETDLELCHFMSQAGHWYTDRFNDVEKSIVLFRKALEIYPDYESALKGLVISLQNKGRMKASLEPAIRLVNLNPNDKENLQIIINCYHGLQMTGELQQACQHYIELFPEEKEAIQQILNTL